MTRDGLREQAKLTTIMAYQPHIRMLIDGAGGCKAERDVRTRRHDISIHQSDHRPAVCNL
jgi:hypothetical protein